MGVLSGNGIVKRALGFGICSLQRRRQGKEDDNLFIARDLPSWHVIKPVLCQGNLNTHRHVLARSHSLSLLHAHMDTYTQCVV